MGHEITDRMSLEMGRRVATRLVENPGLIQVAVDNLDRWTRLNASAPSLLKCYAEWRQILARPVEEICAILSSETEESQRLRQNSPFAGVLRRRQQIKVASPSLVVYINRHE
jgi:hypothetical protein